MNDSASDDHSRFAPEQLALPAARYVPHQGRALLIDTITGISPKERKGRLKLLLKPETPYFKNGCFMNHWLLEIMAQGAGAISQLIGSDAGSQARRGYLIAIRSFTCHLSSPPREGEEIFIDATFDEEVQNFAQCRCRAFRESDELIAQAEMTFFREAEPSC